MAVIANIHEAKTTLSKLIARALAGEEVVIAKAGKPLVELKPLVQKPAVDRASVFGKYRGRMILSDDWEDSPFDAEMHRKWYGEDPAAAARAAENGEPFKRE